MLNEDADERVRSIKKQFLRCVPIKEIRWNNFLECAPWDSQEVLVVNTVDLDIVARYPIKIGYQVAFLKYVIDRLEAAGQEVNDRVYEAFGRLVALPERRECYKHYLFNFEGDKVITLEENPNIISQGTTGLCSWQASLALSEWCLKNHKLFENRTVLELGAGIGLTGLVVALNCNPLKYYFTDYHPVVLKTLSNNILLNVYNSHKDSVISASDGTFLDINEKNIWLQVTNLRWEDINSSLDFCKETDIVLAADVVYDSSLFHSLCSALKCFLSNGSCRIVYLACTERNTETLEDFLKLLGENRLQYKKLKLPHQDYFCWNTEVPVHLLAVEKGTDD